MRTNELEGSFRADPTNGVGVIATAENAKIDELVHGQLKACKHLREMKFEHWQVLLLIGERQATEENRSAECQRVHIFGGCGVGSPGLHEFGALCFGFARSFDDGHAHQAQQAPAFFVLLRRHGDGSLYELCCGFGIACFLHLSQFFLCLCLASFALGEFACLHHGRLAIEDIDRLESVFEQAYRSVKQPKKMRCDFAVRISQVVLTVRTDRHQERVQEHAGVHGNSSAKVMGKVIFNNHFRTYFRE